MERDRTEALLLALCNCHPDPLAQAETAALLAQPIDWQRLSELAALHGVVGLVRRNLLALDARAAVPDQPWQDMEAAAMQIAFAGMVHLRETAHITSLLVGAGIEPVALKGLALADQLYDDPLVRPSGDIDLLVERDQVDAAVAVLSAIGYLPQSDAWLDFQRRHSYDVSLWREVWPGWPVLLELHWDLSARSLFSYDLVAWRRRCETFTVPGLSIALQRFAPDQQLLHLALHMRKHRYVGLHWLADVAQLLRRYQGSLDWQVIVGEAQRAGLRTLLYTTVELAGQLLDAPAPQAWLDRLQPSAPRLRLLRSVLDQTALMAPLETEDAGWTRLAPAEVLLLDRPSAMAREIRHRLFPPVERMTGTAGSGSPAGLRLSLYTQRLARRTATLLHR